MIDPVVIKDPSGIRWFEVGFFHPGELFGTGITGKGLVERINRYFPGIEALKTVEPEEGQPYDVSNFLFESAINTAFFTIGSRIRTATPEQIYGFMNQTEYNFTTDAGLVLHSIENGVNLHDGLRLYKNSLFSRPDWIPPILDKEDKLKTISLIYGLELDKVESESLPDKKIRLHPTFMYSSHSGWMPAPKLKGKGMIITSTEQTLAHALMNAEDIGREGKLRIYQNTRGGLQVLYLQKTSGQIIAGQTEYFDGRNNYGSNRILLSRPL